MILSPIQGFPYAPERPVLVEDLIGMHTRLRSCDGLEDLFVTASALALTMCGSDRALVAPLTDGRLTAHEGRPLADPESEALRLRLQARPVDLRGAIVPSGWPGPAVPEGALMDDTGLVGQLGLREHVCVPVVARTTPLALLIVDRDGPPVSPAERSLAWDVSTVVAIALEGAVLRRRVRELADYVRQFSSLGKVLARDLVGSPILLPTDRGLGLALPPHHGLATVRDLSARELQVAEFLVAGRSNREIAEVLVVSPETVKTYVRRICRKLGASNRVEVVSLLLRTAE